MEARGRLEGPQDTKSEVHICSNNLFYRGKQKRKGYECYRILGQL